MKNIQREDIHIISRHSNLTEKGVEKALHENIYNDKEMWQKFLRLLFISLGIGFTVAGIIFFFAYNWNGLHKFIKLGLTEGLIIATTGVVLFSKVSTTLKNSILTGASFLVGVLFAVFGQIYQTGANAYDFFLGWTIFITLWVIVSNFAPLWLLFILLINTTFFFYSEQVAKDWSDAFIITVFFSINTIVLIGAVLLSIYKKLPIPNWFLYTLTLASTSFATIGITRGFFNHDHYDFTLLFISVPLVFALGMWYGLKIKSNFYLSVIPFSIIIIISGLMISMLEEEAMLLFIGIFIIVSVTLVIKTLMNLQKKWNNEK